MFATERIAQAEQLARRLCAHGTLETGHGRKLHGRI